MNRHPAPNLPDLNQEWRSRAACLGAPSDWFFPTRGGSASRAKAVCRNCPVTSECLADQLRYAAKVGPNSDHGIWGGTTKRDRTAIWQTARTTVAGTIIEYLARYGLTPTGTLARDLAIAPGTVRSALRRLQVLEVADKVGHKRGSSPPENVWTLTEGGRR